MGLLSRWGSWRREQRWRLKRARMYADSDVLVISRTKSGRTWLRVMISHLCHVRFGISERELLQFDNFHRVDSRIPRIHFTHDTVFAHHRPRGRPLAAEPRQRILFLVRDPRDVALSFYHHVKHRASDRELEHKRIARSAIEGAPEDFVTSDVFGVPAIVRFFNKWWQEAPAYPSRLFVRYEDLQADGLGELRRVSDLLGVPFTDDERAEAVRFAAVDAMRERERGGFFDSGRLGGTDLANPDSFKVRQGRVGGYREQLDADCVARLDRLIDEQLDPAYGYRGLGASRLELPAWRAGVAPSADLGNATRPGALRPPGI